MMKRKLRKLEPGLQGCSDDAAAGNQKKDRPRIYQFFRAERSPAFFEENLDVKKSDFATVSKAMSAAWAQLGEEEKHKWQPSRVGPVRTWQKSLGNSSSGSIAERLHAIESMKCISFTMVAAMT